MYRRILMRSMILRKVSFQSMYFTRMIDMDTMPFAYTAALEIRSVAHHATVNLKMQLDILKQTTFHIQMASGRLCKHTPGIHVRKHIVLSLPPGKY